jgi:hypothetical protein
MSDEIQVQSTLIVTRSGVTSKQNAQCYLDQSTPGSWYSEQTVGTSQGDLSLSGITSPVAVNLVNLDETNFIEWGPKSGGTMVPLGKLPPGANSQVILWPGVVLRAVADTAPCVLAIFVV